MYESHLRKSYPTLLNGFILELMTVGWPGRHLLFYFIERKKILYPRMARDIKTLKTVGQLLRTVYI